MQVNKFDDLQLFVGDTVDQIMELIDSKDGYVHIALTGGSTPKVIYSELADEDIDFDRVHFYVLDERYVPMENGDSNAGMIKNTLFEGGDLPDSFVKFDTSKSMRDALTDFESKMPDKFDLILLGVGPDGHIASLFPGSSALYSMDRVVQAETEEFAVRERLSIGMEPIMNADKILVVLSNKPTALEAWESGERDMNDWPAMNLLMHDNVEVNYFQDKE